MVDVTFYLGDCLELMRTMPHKCVDAIITDLPYGTTACSWDEIIPFAPMWEQVKRINKGVFVTTASQPFTSKLVLSNPKDFKYCLVWNKKLAGNFLNANFQPLKIHEDVVVFSSFPAVYTKNNEPMKYNPQKSNGATRKGSRSAKPNLIGKRKKHYEYFGVGGDERHPTSIIEISNAVRIDKTHPTEKPIALMEYLIKTYTDEGDTIFDPCMGSGTTGVACVQTGRNFIGCEIDPTYFAIAEKRIKDAQQQIRLPLEAVNG